MSGRQRRQPPWRSIPVPYTIDPARPPVLTPQYVMHYLCRNADGSCPTDDTIKFVYRSNWCSNTVPSWMMDFCFMEICRGNGPPSNLPFAEPIHSNKSGFQFYNDFYVWNGYNRLTANSKKKRLISCIKNPT